MLESLKEKWFVLREYPRGAFLSFGMAAGGLYQLVFSSPPSVSAAFSSWAQIIWSLLLFVGGTLAFVGQSMRTNRRPYGGIKLETVGSFMVSLGALVYGLVLTFANPSGKFPALFVFICFAISAGYWARRYQLERYKATIEAITHD